MPNWKEAITIRLAGLKLEPTREAEILEELSQHLDDRYRELRSAGATSEHAYAAALQELDDDELLTRELKRVEKPAGEPPIALGASNERLLSGILADIRYGFRILRRNPGFTLTAVLTLALGIGANTAIFSVVNGVLLRPLPFPQPDRLATFWASSPEEGLRKMEWTDRLFVFLHERSQTFEKLAAYDGGNGLNLTGRGEAARLTGTVVTSDFFDVMGRAPLLGRGFFTGEDRPGKNKVAILSHRLWRQRFGGDPGIVGQSLTLNNEPTEVVGVMPPDFEFPSHTDLWVPVGLQPDGPSESWYIDPVGRLKPGLTIADADSEIAGLFAEYARLRNWPQGDSRSAVFVRPLIQLVVGGVRKPLLILLGAVALVLLIACANIANLLLARATTRTREIALRCCLGASRARIVRQLLTESLLISVLGAALGLMPAIMGVQALKHLVPDDLARIEQIDQTGVQLPRIDEVSLDTTALLFASAISLLTGVVFGLAPALRSSGVELHEAIKEGVRGSASRSSRTLSNTFVVTQFALSLVLLVGAALLLESFRNLLSVQPGFRSANVWTGRVDLPENKYTSDAQRRIFYKRLLERVQSLPGVQAAGLCQRLPFFGGGDGNGFSAEGREPSPDQSIKVAWERDVSTGYFEAMGIPLLAGRTFSDSDTDKSPLVAVVDEKLAHTFWPNEDPLGKRIRVGRASSGTPLMTVVGVVASVKHRSLDEDSRYYVYWPVSQDIRSSMYMVIRTQSTPESMTPAMLATISELDPELPLFEVLTMEKAVSYSLTAKKLTNTLLAGFAVTALLLALIGIYGVISLNVGGRTHEFGIRMALGAQPSQVLRLVIAQGMKLTLIGIALGVLAALWLTSFLEGLLFEVKPTDPATFAAVTALLAVVGLVACYVPARRATKVDPMVALRCE